MKKHNFWDIAIFILSAELVGVISALLSGGFGDFYDNFTPPPLLPPSWLFPVVWTVLYAVMGFSAYLVYSSEANQSDKTKALKIYWAQLAVNFLWSIVFFRFEALWPAVVIIVVLFVLIAMMIAVFRKISPLAALINIPYLLWVAFAAYLTIAVAVIN